MMEPSAIYRPVLHHFATATAWATFPLIFIGGLVTSHGAGLAVPDWPNSFGYNMFLFPPSHWVGNILYEHTHRLYAASIVGPLSIAVCVLAWRMEPRRWVRWLGTGMLAMVIVQGVLGGLRVVLVNLDLAIVHACFAQAFFCYAVLMAMVTGRGWIEAPDLSQGRSASVGRSLVRAGLAAVAVIYLQLVVGAVMRHEQAGLAIPDFPLVYGKLLPPTSAAAVAAINRTSMVSPAMQGMVTLGQIWLHFAHRLGAVAVLGVVTWVVVRVLRGGPALREFVRPAMVVAGLVVLQIVLGIVTVLWRKPADVASAHVAVGALTLVSMVMLTVRGLRAYGRRVRHMAVENRAGDGPALEDGRSLVGVGGVVAS